MNVIIAEGDRPFLRVGEISAWMSRRAPAQFGRDIVGAGVAADELRPTRSFPVVLTAPEAGVRPDRVFAVRRGGVIPVRFEPVVRAAERSEIAGAGRPASAIGLPGDRMVRVAPMGRTDAEIGRASCRERGEGAGVERGW